MKDVACRRALAIRPMVVLELRRLWACCINCSLLVWIKDGKACPKAFLAMKHNSRSMCVQVS